MKIPLKCPQPNTANRRKRELRWRVAKRDGCKCKHCGDRNSENLTMDHVTPRCKGGKDIVENLQILCKKCHFKKTQLDFQIIYHEQGK